MDTLVYFKLLNFTVFIVLLYVLLRRPLREFWEIRAQEIGFHINEAHQKRVTAEAQLKEHQKKLVQLEQEMAAVIEQFKREGTLEKEKLREKGESLARRLHADSTRLIDQEVRKTKVLLQEELARLTVQWAEQMYLEHKTSQDDDRLVEKSLRQLQAALHSPQEVL